MKRLSLAIFLIPTTWATAASVFVDVSQHSAPSYADFGDGTGQTFTSAAGGYLEGVSLYISKGGSGADVSLTIHALNTAGTGLKSIVSSATVSKSSLPDSAGWVYFDLNIPVLHSVGSTLAFTVSTPASGPSGYLNYWYSNANPYSGGARFNAVFSVIAGSDFAFMTHNSPIPEPASIFLAGASIFGMLTFRSRQTR